MLRITALFALVGAAVAVPALVWKTEPTETVYTSSQVKPDELLNGVGVGSRAVVFLLARAASGSDSLTELAPLMSRTAESQPSEVHSYVSEMRNGVFLGKEAAKQGHASLVVNLSELSAKLSPMEEEIVVDASGGMMSKSQVKKTKRAKQLEKANVLIVNVDANVDPQTLDRAVMEAVQHDSIDNVVLTAVRSVGEVKYERRMNEQRRLQSMEKAGRKLQQSQRRRLEDADGGDANGDYSSDLQGVYYVSLTPNILAGILFFLLFSTIAFIGISCMGMIAGQDVYVKKLPSVGREA